MAKTSSSEPSIEQIGTALVRLRKRTGASQTAFGRPAKIRHQQLSRYELGEELPALGTLLRLLTSHGLTLGDLQAELDDLAGRPSRGSLEARLARLETQVAEITAAPKLGSQVLDQIIDAMVDRLTARRSAPPRP